MSKKDYANNTPDIPDWKIERFLLGELDEVEMEKIRRAAAEDEPLRAKLESMERSNREILGEYPADRMAGQIRERLRHEEGASPATSRKPRFRIPRLVLVPAAIVAVIAVAVFVFPNLFPGGHETGNEVTRLKGPEQQLRLYRKTASGSQQLQNGDRAAEHDRVLLQYQAETGGYGAIISVDGWGTITTHLPGSGIHAAKLEPRRARFLEYSCELDAAPRWEVFFFVTSPSDFVVDTVVQAIEKAVNTTGGDGDSGAGLDPPRTLDLPEHYKISIFTLVKDSRHEN